MILTWPLKRSQIPEDLNHGLQNFDWLFYRSWWDIYVYLFLSAYVKPSSSHSSQNKFLGRIALLLFCAITKCCLHTGICAKSTRKREYLHAGLHTFNQKTKLDLSLHITSSRIAYSGIHFQQHWPFLSFDINSPAHSALETERRTCSI